MTLYHFTLRAEDSLGRSATRALSIDLEQEATGPVPFYAGDLITSTGWEAVTWPSAVYDAANNRTLVAWQFIGLGSYKAIHVAAYDHAAGTWSRPYTAGTFSLANDDHGHPALVIDAEGYVHCFFGSHATDQLWSVTAAPGDISSWVPRPAISSGWYTYPKPVLVGSKILLFIRDTLDLNRLELLEMTPSGGDGTWSAPKGIVEFGIDTRVYTTECHLVDGMVHFTCMFTQRTDVTRLGVYYFRFDPDTGDVSNYDGSVTVASGSLPIGLAAANAGFRVYDHGAGHGDVPSLQFDSAGVAHVLFADGTGSPYDLKHMALEAGGWTPPFTVGQIEDTQPAVGYIDTYALAQSGEGVAAWFNVDGSKVRRVRSAGGAWSAAEVIAPKESLNFIQGTAVKSSAPQIRAVFSENAGGATDSLAKKVKMYAHGDNGFVQAQIPASEDPLWDDVELLVSPGAGGSGRAIDSSKNALPLTFVGAAQSSSDGPLPGMRSLRTGNGNYVTVPRVPELTTEGQVDFSITAWFKIANIDPGRLQVIASTRTSGFSILVNEAATLQFLMWTGGTLRLNIIGATALVEDRWYYLEVSRQGAESFLFLDGELEASGVQSADPDYGATGINIGRDAHQSGRHFDGWISEFRFTRNARNVEDYSPPIAPSPR